MSIEHDDGNGGDDDDAESPELPPLKEVLKSYASAFKEISAVGNPNIPGNRCVSYIMAMMLPENEEENFTERLYIDVKIGGIYSVTPSFFGAAMILQKYKGVTNAPTMCKWIAYINGTANGHQSEGDVTDVSHGELEEDEDLMSAVYGMDTNIMNFTTVLQRMNYTGSWLFAMEHVTDEKVYRNVHGGGLSSTMPSIAVIKHILSNIDIETGSLDIAAVRQSIVSEKGIFDMGLSAEEEILDTICNLLGSGSGSEPSSANDQGEENENENGMDVDEAEDILRQLDEMEAIERQGDDLFNKDDNNNNNDDDCGGGVEPMVTE